MTKRRRELEGPLRDFVEEIRDPDPPDRRARRGTGIFLDANPETTPLALRANVEHNYVAARERGHRVGRDAQRAARRRGRARDVDDLGYRDDGITHVTARFGFQDDLDVPRTLARAAKRLEREADFERVSYFLSRISIIATTPRNGALAQEACSSRSRATRPTRSATSTCPRTARS